jgi:repressor LexA
VTDRQREVLTFISGYLVHHGVPPTLNEVAKGLGLSHRSTVHSHIQALVRDGHLEARPVRGVTAYFPVETSAAA